MSYFSLFSSMNLPTKPLQECQSNGFEVDVEEAVVKLSE